MSALHKFFFLFICVSLCPNLRAQNEVPNIIMTDIQGNERNLYQSLADGKVVIVDVFGTWCTTCWEIKQSDILQRIYNTYGPEGTQQLEIFSIEGDSESDLETIYGDGSFGDWTEDTSYPIFSPAQLSGDFFEAFAPDGLPTTNVICPQTRENTADIYQSSLSEIIEIIQNCNTISNVNDAQIVKPMESTLAICQPTDLRFSVLNTGTETISALTIEATYADGTMFNNLNLDTPLEPGESSPINFGEIALPDFIDFQNLDLNILTPDDVLTNNVEPIVIRHAASVPNKLTLKVKSDSYVEADSTRWWIEDGFGESIFPETFLSNDETVEVEIPLVHNDCYTFVIMDDYGDGFLLGEIELATDDGTVIFDETNFMFRGEACFEFQGSTVTSTQTLAADEGYVFSLESNLIQDELTAQIVLPSLQKFELIVIDLNGHLLISNSITPSTTQFENTMTVQDLPQGVYFMQLATEQGILTRKFINQ